MSFYSGINIPTKYPHTCEKQNMCFLRQETTTNTYKHKNKQTLHETSLSSEPEKKPSYFPLNPGCLIGILISWFMK